MKNTKRSYGQESLVILASTLLALVLLAGCSSPAPQAPEVSAPEPTTLPVADAACTTKECFISLAGDCKEISLTFTEDAGVLKYSSSKDCVFTKTLVSLNADETQEMKNLFEGKSLTCRYEKGKFDQRWVTSLIFGIEYCEGELRDILVELIAFA